MLRGFSNRRFERVFGYFCRAAKVTGGVRGREAPGLKGRKDSPLPLEAAKNPLVNRPQTRYDTIARLLATVLQKGNANV